MLYNKTRIGFIKTLKRMGAEIQVINKRKVNFEILADLKIDQKKIFKANNFGSKRCSFTS